MRRVRQQGLGAVAAIVVLLLLAVLAASVVRLSTSSQQIAGQSLQAARAQQAARAGLEWGTRQVLAGAWAGCAGNPSQLIDLRADNGMQVSVRCERFGDYTEAGATRRVYRLEAVACNGGGACPDNAAAIGPHYVERKRQLLLSD